MDDVKYTKEITEEEKVKETLLSSAEIQSRFGYNAASIEGPNPSAKVHKDLRLAFVEFSAEINMHLGKSRYAALAQTALEEASMWSHKAIAANDPINPEV